MICANCGSTAAGVTCTSCGRSPLLDGRYELVEPLGRGALGTTWRALHRSDGRPVAVKELRLERLDSPKSMALFERECEVLSQLRHPGIPAFLERFRAGEHRTTGFYLVQELIEGKSLAQELREKRHTEAEVVAVLLDVLEALAYLQSLRPAVVHRDLKPENLVRRSSDGRVMLVDFGAVHAAARTEAGSTLAGTPGYMAPEQLKGFAEPATDLYALGCVALAMLTRRAPIELLDERFELRWEKAASGVSFGLRAALRRMLHPDPRRRPRSAAELARELRTPRKRSRLHRGWIAMAAAGLAGIAVAAQSSGGPPSPEPSAPVAAAAVAPARAQTSSASAFRTSACIERGSCARVRDGLPGHEFEDMCAEFLKDPSARTGRPFQTEIDGLTASCEPHVVVTDRCSVRCTLLRDPSLMGAALLARAERVAQFLRDRFGPEHSQNFYRQVSWAWNDGNTASMWLSAGDGTTEGIIMLTLGARVGAGAEEAEPEVRPAPAGG